MWKSLFFPSSVTHCSKGGVFEKKPEFFSKREDR